MKIKYFKTPIWGDGYVAREDYMNIVTISDVDFCCMANDEGYWGPYKNIRVTPEDFKELKEFAKDSNRKKGITLLKKIHENNKEALEKNPVFAKNKEDFPDDCVPFKWRDHYNSTKPILE